MELQLKRPVSKIQAIKKELLSQGMTPFIYWMMAWPLYIGMTFFLFSLQKENDYPWPTVLSFYFSQLVIHFALIKFKASNSLSFFIQKNIVTNHKVWTLINTTVLLIITFQCPAPIQHYVLLISFLFFQISLISSFGLVGTLICGLAFGVSSFFLMLSKNPLPFHIDESVSLFLIGPGSLFFSLLNSYVRNKIGELIQFNEELLKKNSNLNQYLEKFWDLTSKFKDQNLKLKELDTQKTHFFQSLSHELRTPLTLLEHPLENCLKKDPKNKDLKLAKNNATRLHHLVNQLLNFQKASAEKDKLKVNPINIIKFLKNISENFHQNCKLHKINFEFLVSDRPLKDINQEDYQFFIEANLDALEKIIYNYLSNAHKYSPTNGKITLSISKGNNKIRIGVKDNGPGISPKNQKKIFKSFAQIHEGMGKEGTGLGLALVKELTESMKGQVGIESKVNEGSFFWADFPQYTPRNIIDLVLITPKEVDTSPYKNIFQKDFSWEEIHTLGELRNLSKLFYPKLIIIDYRLEDSQENLELWEDITDFIPDTDFLSLEKETKIDDKLKETIDHKIIESMVKDRPILFDYDLLDLLIISKDENDRNNYKQYFKKYDAIKNIKVVTTAKQAKKSLKLNKFKCILINLEEFQELGLPLLKFAHLVSSLTKKVAIINTELLKTKKSEIIDVPYIDRYILNSHDFLPHANMIERFVEESSIISTESYQVKNWILDYKKQDNKNNQEEKNYYQLEEAKLESKEGVGKTVLILDDLKDMRDLLKSTLLPLGYKVIACHNSIEALERAKWEIPDLILVDWLLKEMTGLTFIKKIKEGSETTSIPTILLTAKSDEESKLIGTQSGADAFLGKPFNQQELRSIIKNLIHLKDHEKSLKEKNHKLEVSILELDYMMDEMWKQKKGQEQILNNIQEGLLVFDLKGDIQEQGSLYSEQLFEKDIFQKDAFESLEKRKIWNILDLDNEEKKHYKTWMKNVWKGTLPFKDMVSLVPSEHLKVKGKHINLNYKTITKNDESKAVEKIICIAQDKTKEKNLEKLSIKSQKEADVLKSCLDRPIEFVELILDSKEFKENFSTQNIKNSGDLFRKVHTLKARFGFFSIVDITFLLNEMESNIENKDSKKLENSFNNFSHGLDTFIQKHRSLIEASNKFLIEQDKAIPTEDLLQQIKNCSGLSDLKIYILNNFILTDLKNKFSKYTDFVKEIGEKQGKLVQLEIDGPEILINRNKYQNFVNTSIHLFRNMVDHGLEEEHIRIEKTKPKIGKIRGRFSLDNERIIIVIEDDGRGLDLNKIKEKCLQIGLKKEEEFIQLKEDEISRFIFEPGFSTKEEVTDYSGRGIGLDSVKKEVDLLGGTIDVESAQDVGTRFIINLPLLKDI